jgi:hypothetical protein
MLRSNRHRHDGNATRVAGLAMGGRFFRSQYVVTGLLWLPMLRIRHFGISGSVGSPATVPGAGIGNAFRYRMCSGYC